MATRRKTKAETNQSKAILESVKNLKPEDVTAQIGDLQTSLQATLAGISASAVSKIEELHNIDTAIREKLNKLMIPSSTRNVSSVWFQTSLI